MVGSGMSSVTIAALFQHDASEKCLTKVPASPPSFNSSVVLPGLWQDTAAATELPTPYVIPTAVGSCVLKFMLGFEFLYNLPQEVKAAKQSLYPLTRSVCSYI